MKHFQKHFFDCEFVNANALVKFGLVCLEKIIGDLLLIWRGGILIPR